MVWQLLSAAGADALAVKPRTPSVEPQNVQVVRISSSDKLLKHSVEAGLPNHLINGRNTGLSVIETEQVH